MQVFVIINNVGIKMNADVNAKNILTKEDVVKDLLGILVIVIVNVISQVMLENIWIIKTVNVEKNLVDKLVEKCSENVDGNKMIYNDTLNGYKNDAILVQYTLYY